VFTTSGNIDELLFLLLPRAIFKIVILKLLKLRSAPAVAVRVDSIKGNSQPVRIASIAKLKNPFPVTG
jgi:hypothetical protein